MHPACWLWLCLLFAVPAAGAEEDALPEGAKLRLGTNKLRHGGNVMSVTISPDGKRAASAAADRIVRIWDVQTGRRVAESELLPTVPSVLRFSPDGKSLAGSDYYNDVRIWDAASGKVRAAGRQTGGSCLAWSPDGKTIASGSRDGRVRLWDAANGNLIRTILGIQYGNVLAVAFASDGGEVLAIGYDGILRRWETKTGNLVWQFHLTRDAHRSSLSPNMHAFSTDGKHLAAGSTDRGLYLWPTAKAEPPRTFVADTSAGGLGCVSFSADGRFLASAGSTGTVSVWGVATGRELRTFPGTMRQISSVALSPDASVAAAGNGSLLQLWNTGDGKPLHSDAVPLAPVRSVAFLDGGKTLATLHEDGGLSAWDGKTGKHRERLPDRCDPQGGLGLAAGGKAVRAMSAPQGWIDWIPGGRKEVRPWTGDWLRPLAPDGRTFLRLERGLGQPHDAETDKELKALSDPPSSSPLTTWSPDSQRFVARGPADGLLRAWDVEQGRVIAVFPPAPAGPQPYSPSFLSPGGRMLVQGTNELRVWEAASGRERLRIPIANRQLTAGVFTADGRTLIAGLNTGEVIGLDLDTGREVLRRAGHRGAVRCLRFSPDGALLASGSEDTTVLLWETGPFRVPRQPVAKPAPEAVARWWDDLASDDAVKAYAVVRAMGDAPAESVPLIKVKLEPIKDDVTKRIARLIADLDDRRFQLRERAMKELAEIGSDAEKPLEQALRGTPSLDARRRMEELLKQVKSRPQEGRLRGLRAVEVLERTGTPEALEVVTALAGGAPEAWLTREAKAALQRR